MSRTAAMVLAGLGVLDLAYIDIALAPALLSTDTDTAVTGNDSPSEQAQAKHPLAATRQIHHDKGNRSPKNIGSMSAKRAAPEPQPERKAEREAEEVLPADESIESALGSSEQRTWLLLFPQVGQDWVPRIAEAPLAQIARRANASPNHEVIVDGHCDSRGTRQHNRNLAQRRAEAVAAHLTSLGVDEARIQLRSFGEERPAVAGSSREARSKNRRVEVVVRPSQSRSRTQ